MTRFLLPTNKLPAIATIALCALLLFGALCPNGIPLAAPARADSFNVGLITSGPTVDDQGFDWYAYQGLLRAQTDLGVVGTVYTSPSESDYEARLQQCVDDGNSLCISVSFSMADATLNKSATNGTVLFAIVDVEYESYPQNLRGLTFASDEVAYLAGTLAGLMTGSDVIGTIGGMPIATVDGFLNGYRNGATCANPGVTVLTSYLGSFTDLDLGAQAAQEMMDAGADVIFPAAGPAGYAALLTATQAGAWGIGVDTDQYVTVFEAGVTPGAAYMLTSAMKRIDNAVFDTIADALSGGFTSGTVVYDLAVDGVGLAPFHEATPSVPQSVRDQVESVRLDIIAGAIDVTAPCQGPGRVFLPLVASG